MLCMWGRSLFVGGFGFAPIPCMNRLFVLLIHWANVTYRAVCCTLTETTLELLCHPPSNYPPIFSEIHIWRKACVIIVLSHCSQTQRFKCRKAFMKLTNCWSHVSIGVWHTARGQRHRCFYEGAAWWVSMCAEKRGSQKCISGIKVKPFDISFIVCFIFNFLLNVIL